MNEMDAADSQGRGRTARARGDARRRAAGPDPHRPTPSSPPLEGGPGG